MIVRLSIAYCFLGTVIFAQADDIPTVRPAEIDTVREYVRRSRAIRFNVRLPFSLIETAPGRGHPFVKVMHETQPELPYREADTVVVGEVVELQPFLSADGKGLYTEYSVSVSRVLKSAAYPIPLVGHILTLLREGGAVRLPNGTVAKHDIRGDPTPKVHQKYLFFLTAEPELEGFSYRKFWGVENELLKPAFQDDLSLGSRSTIAGRPLADIVSLLAEQGSK